MTAKEQELKLLINNKGFQKLLNIAECNSIPLRQTNYYFDTPELDLEKNGITLRIRQQNTDWYICLKAKKGKNRHYSFVTSLELENKVTDKALEECRSNPNVIVNYLQKEARLLLQNIININKLNLLGFINNERYCMKLFKNFIFELDYSTFPNGIESYELEIEGIKNEAECEDIMNFINSLSINFQINQKSKYKRFIDSLFN